MNRAILKDKILELLIKDRSINNSYQIIELLKIDTDTTRELLQEMQQQGHLKLEKLTSQLAYAIIVTPEGRMFSGYVKEIEKQEALDNETPSPTNIIGNTGNVFYQSPPSESIIKTAAAPTVTPKKNKKTSKIIMIVAAVITIISGLILIYRFLIK